jgi:hypothetical protein
VKRACLGVALVLSGCFSGYHHEAKAGVDANERGRPEGVRVAHLDVADSPKVEIIYSDKVGAYFKTVSIIWNGRVVRAFHGSEEDGYYLKDIEPMLSEDKNFVVLNKVETSEIDEPQGEPELHERAYCSIVNVRNGCMIALETGEFCAGEFDRGSWVSDSKARVDLADATPKRKDASSADPEDVRYSNENLKYCERSKN